MGEEEGAVTYRDEVMLELKRLEEDILYTEKAHFAQADNLRVVHYVLGGLATLASALAAASAVKSAPDWAALLALIATTASALITFVKPESRAEQHLGSARSLGALRVRIRQVYSLDLHEDRPEAGDQWRAAVEDFAKQKADIDVSSPNTGELAFRGGKKKIERGDFLHGDSPSNSPQ
jgi:hypothetical protein